MFTQLTRTCTFYQILLNYEYLFFYWLYLANEKVRRHNKTVYDRIAIRHVAEQIDELYWQAAEPYDLLDGELYGEDILRQDDDLTSDE